MLKSKSYIRSEIIHCAGGVTAARSASQQIGCGSTPTPALRDLKVRPLPNAIASAVITKNHYLHAYPGATKLAFGVFLGSSLMGAVTLGAGPSQVFRLVEGASRHDCMTLTRVWLSDDLPQNSESRVLAFIIRQVRKYSAIKFLVTYADPAMGHVGIIYQALGWKYTGLSEPTPLYDLGDGHLRHPRSVGASLGTRSVRYLRKAGFNVSTIEQAGKHRYILFLDRAWAHRILAPLLPYPRKEAPQ